MLASSAGDPEASANKMHVFEHVTAFARAFLEISAPQHSHGAYLDKETVIYSSSKSGAPICCEKI